MQAADLRALVGPGHDHGEHDGSLLVALGGLPGHAFGGPQARREAERAEEGPVDEVEALLGRDLAGAVDPGGLAVGQDVLGDGAGHAWAGVSAPFCLP